MKPIDKTNMYAQNLNKLKAECGRNITAVMRVSDDMREQATALASQILYRRLSRPADAACIAGLTVGALIERGMADLAERVTVELAYYGASAKGKS